MLVLLPSIIAMKASFQHLLVLEKPIRCGPHLPHSDELPVSPRILRCSDDILLCRHDEVGFSAVRLVPQPIGAAANKTGMLYPV